MKLFHLLQAYEFDEIMPVINDMFPGTNKFRPQLKMAYDRPSATKSCPATSPTTRMWVLKTAVSTLPGRFVWARTYRVGKVLT